MEPPTTLRTSLERAVADGRALLACDEPLVVDAAIHHQRASGGTPRTVGAAGAVMAVRLGVGAEESALIEEFAPRWRASLRAIERMCVLDWVWAWRMLYGASGTRQVPAPHVEFAERIEAAIPRPPRELREFTTHETYRAWLDHIEHDVIDVLGTIEDALSAEVFAVREPVAPDTLAGALAVALADGRARASAARTGDTHYRFESEVWHNACTEWGEACAVCAAGCVIAGTLGRTPSDTVHPDNFSAPWESALVAIEEVRTERWRSAFRTMHGERHAGATHFDQAMRADLQEISPALREVHFSGLAQYERWLDHVETTLLPSVTANEREALAHT